MFNKKFIKKAEAEVNKRLKKYYRGTSYCCIDKVTFNLDDCEDIIELDIRVGYETEKDKYYQKEVKALFSMNIYHTPNELAAVLLTKSIEALDGIEFFETK